MQRIFTLLLGELQRMAASGCTLIARAMEQRTAHASHSLSFHATSSIKPLRC